MVDNFAKADAAVANAFFQQFYTALLQDLFFVLTDTDHKSGMLDLFFTVTYANDAYRIQDAVTASHAPLSTCGIECPSSSYL
jgi:hypothetical protein